MPKPGNHIRIIMWSGDSEQCFFHICVMGKENNVSEAEAV